MTQNDMGYVAPTTFKPIEAGIHDFVIHGIVGLGVREPFKGANGEPLKDTKGNPAKPYAAIRIIFELPNSVREDGQTDVISVDMKLSPHGKSKLFKLYRACLGDSIVNGHDKQGNPTMSEMRLHSSNLKELLGKCGSLTVIHKTSKAGREFAKVDTDSIAALHPKVPKPVATRETFFFNPAQPDLNVFRDTLTHWTRKSIMEALNASVVFPKELHDEYHKLEQEWNDKQEEKKNTSNEEEVPWEEQNSFNTEAIE